MYAINRVKLLFKRYPFLINATTYGTLMGSAEFCNQTLTKKVFPKQDEDRITGNKEQNDGIDKEYDWKSIARYSGFGTCALGPSLFYWYRLLDKLFPGKTAKTIAKKVVFDQLCFGLPYLGVFFTAMNILEFKEHPFEGVVERWRNAFLFGSCYWIPVQASNFYFVPPQLRVIYVGTMSFIWTNVLIFMRR